jgi:hypothetical protein
LLTAFSRFLLLLARLLLATTLLLARLLLPALLLLSGRPLVTLLTRVLTAALIELNIFVRISHLSTSLLKVNKSTTRT